MSNPEKVVCLSEFKAKKNIKSELTRNRKPLFLSHLTGTATSNEKDEKNLGDRISRIKYSLEKINSLMKDLKSISSKKK